MSSRTIIAGRATIAGLVVATLLTSSELTGRQSADVNEIVRKTKSLYDATTSAEVSFVQTASGSTMSGTMQFAKGNRYRLEFPKQSIISNGTTVWTYTPARKQVVVSKASARKGGLTPNDILTKFPGSYRTTLGGETKVDGRAVWIVKAVAGAEKIGDVSSATLYIDKATNRFQKIEMQSASMGAVTVRITKARYNLKIPDARFTFTPPTGVRVIKL